MLYFLFTARVLLVTSNKTFNYQKKKNKGTVHVVIHQLSKLTKLELSKNRKLTKAKKKLVNLLTAYLRDKTEIN